VKTQDEDDQTNLTLPSREEESDLSLVFRRLALENAENIGLALVDKARKGNCNAAHLLLEFGGLGVPAKPRPEPDPAIREPRMLLLDLLDKLMLEKPSGKCEATAQDKTENDRRGR